MSRGNVLVADAVAAIVIAAIVLILVPGLAIAALIAIFVVLVCAISLFVDLRRRRRRGARLQPRRTRR